MTGAMQIFNNLFPLDNFCDVRSEDDWLFTSDSSSCETPWINNYDQYPEEICQDRTQCDIVSLGACNRTSNLTEWLNVDSELDKFLSESSSELPNDISYLPDKTLLCSDSCEDFLRESSEQLLMATGSMCVLGVNLFTFDGTSPEDAQTEDGSKSETPIEEKTFPCTHRGCFKVYAKSSHLKAHARRHSGDKPFFCSWPNCNWKFSRSDELARHFRSHSGVKPYKCEDCPKSFCRSDHLAKHKKVHRRRQLLQAKLEKNHARNSTSKKDREKQTVVKRP